MLEVGRTGAVSRLASPRDLIASTSFLLQVLLVLLYQPSSGPHGSNAQEEGCTILQRQAPQGQLMGLAGALGFPPHSWKFFRQSVTSCRLRSVLHRRAPCWAP